MGAMQTFFGLGAFLGPVLGTRLESWAGSWSVSFYAYGVAGIAMAIVAAVVIPLEFTDAGPAPSLARTAENADRVDLDAEFDAECRVLRARRVLVLLLFGAIRELRPHGARLSPW